MIMSFVNIDKVIFSFLICLPLISFSCIIALARTVLNRNGTSGHSCLFLMWGKAFSLSALSRMIAAFCRCPSQVAEMPFNSLFA